MIMQIMKYEKTEWKAGSPEPKQIMVSVEVTHKGAFTVAKAGIAFYRMLKREGFHHTAINRLSDGETDVTAKIGLYLFKMMPGDANYSIRLTFRSNGEQYLKSVDLIRRMVEDIRPSMRNREETAAGE